MGKEDYKNEKKGHGFLCVPKELLFDNRYKQLTIEAILLYLIRLTYDFIGLENYKAVLADPNFFKAFLNSVLWTLGSLAGQLIIGFTGALAINRVNFGKGIYRTLMIIPWAFPSIVIALSWKWILNGVSGFIPNILVQLGICNELPQFLSDNSFVFLTLIFINIWFGAPMIMVNVLSALQTIPQDQYEAAQIDGASKVQQFWYITVPHIKVVVGLLVVLRTIWVFNNFDIIYLLTGGGPANATTTMPIYAYNMGWNTKLLGRSSAVTMLLLAFLLLVCVIYFTITVIAAADARYGGTHDSKSKINTAFAKSTDGGNTWGEPTLPMKFDDYVAKNIDWPRDSVGKNVQIQGSASYIDPVLLEDKSTHRVFLFADLMPAGIGSSNASVGSGFKEINGKKYLKLHWKDDSSSDYNYSIRENGIIYDDTTNASTEYSVDGEYNLYKNGEALTCKQYDYNFEGTSLLETPTDKK